MAAVASSMSLPTVDLSKARDPAQRSSVAKQLAHALKTDGFLFLDNVEGFDSERLLHNVRWFFNLSHEVKHKVAKRLWNAQNSNRYRGYFPLMPDEVSFKEGFEIGHDSSPAPDSHTTDHLFFFESNQWPIGTDGWEKFHEDITQYYRTMLKCGSEILQLVCLAYGQDEEWFQPMFFPNSLSTLRLLHYPPRLATELPETARDGDSILCCSEHTDSGYVTLLATFHYAGLQIQKEDGEWIDVPCHPNSLVMNIGDMLSAMSKGKFKATKHRVIDTGVERFSVPFFFEPRYSADITCVMPWLKEDAQDQTTANGLPESRAKSKLYGPWLAEKMQIFAEYKDM